MTKAEIKRTEEWLDERKSINETFGDKADIYYYKGAIAVLGWMGFEVRFENHKHKLFKF